MTENTHTAKTTSDRITVRFGDVLLEEGHTTVPNLVLNHYTELGIKHSEMLFIIHVWQFWWTEKNPYPALSTVAKRMGMERRQVQYYVKSLREQEYLEDPSLRILRVNDRISSTGQMTNEYDFSGLLKAIVILHEGGALTPKNLRKTKSKQGVQDLAWGEGVQDSASPRVQDLAPEEDKDKEDEVDLNPSDIQKSNSSNHKKPDQKDSNRNSDAVPENPPVGIEPESVQPTVHRGMESVGESLQRKLAALTTEHQATNHSQPGRRRKRKPDSLSHDEYDDLIRMVKDYARQNGGAEEYNSHVTHACNIIEQTKCTYSVFYGAAIEAQRQLTAKRMKTHVEKPMGYWFVCLETDLGVKPRQNSLTAPN